MRETFHEQLGELRQELVEMAGLVGTALERATVALLQADLTLAESVISDDEVINRMREALDERAIDLIALQQPVATDLRTIVAGLRINADLERMGDLARNIAKIARSRYPDCAVPDALRPTLQRMDEVARRLLGKAAEVILSRDAAVAAQLAHDDDEMDALHHRLLATMLEERAPANTEAAIDVTLLGRYYERFADHAVSIAHRIVYLVTGSYPARA
jgi:phosphate transport system protein